MQELANKILQIGKTSSRNDKEELLQRYAATPGFKEILQFIYNPYVRTGIAKAKLKKARVGFDGLTITWERAIEYFTGHQTGSDADASFGKTFIEQQEGEAKELAEAIVTKTLKIGVTEKTLNKIYGENFIPMVGIMKAEKYKDFKNKVKGPFIVTEKLDGARRLIIKENGRITLSTRSGLPDEGLVDIEREAVDLPDNCVYDGELLAIGEFTDSIAQRQATNAIASRKGVRTGLTFNIFDMVPIEDYKRGISTHGALERKTLLGALFGDESIECLSPYHYKELIDMYKLPHTFDFTRPVPIEGIANTEDDVLMLTNPIWRRGFEGTMLNTFSGKYDLTVDRSKEILKVKNTEEIVLEVVDIEEGNGKNVGRTGALVVEYKGNRVGVSGRMSDVQRQQWWDKPSTIIGKSIEIDYFGESTNKQGGVSLNCPIFKRVVGEVD